MSGHNSYGNEKNTCFEERINFLMLLLVCKGNFSGFVVIFIFPLLTKFGHQFFYAQKQLPISKTACITLWHI